MINNQNIKIASVAIAQVILGLAFVSLGNADRFVTFYVSGGLATAVFFMMPNDRGHRVSGCLLWTIPLIWWFICLLSLIDAMKTGSASAYAASLGLVLTGILLGVYL